MHVLLPNFFFKKPKIAKKKNNKKPKNIFFDVFASFAASFAKN